MAGDRRYATSAVPYNALYRSIRPVGIALCADESDARKALLWARETGETFTVMSGGHSYAGYSTCRGLVIDLSHLNGVSFNARDGRLTVGVGARNAQLYAILPQHRVGLPHGRCPDAGMGGYVLGGGFGFTSRSLGMFCDHLVSTEIITASGEAPSCDSQHDSDLFWACRGGAGGSFGINTSYTFQTRPFPERVSVFQIKWPWSDAAEVLHATQALMRDAPEELGAQMGFGAAGLQHRQFIAYVLGEYDGPVTELRNLLDPLLATGQPTLVKIEELSHADAIRFLADNIPSDEFAAKSSYAIEPFSAKAIDTFVEVVGEVPGSSNPGGTGIAIFCLGGAVNRVAPADTAYVHRTARFLINYEASWEASDARGVVEANKRWLQSAYDALQPYVLPSSYQNWPDRTLSNWPSAYYGTNLMRLTQAKARYDPHNLFRYAQSIPQSV